MMDSAMADDADELHVVLDFAPDTLRSLACRIEVSVHAMQQVYRENELDEVWRWVEGALGQALVARSDATQVERLQRIRSDVMAVHDLVGNDADMGTAALRLRALAEQLSSHPLPAPTTAARMP